MVARSYQSGVDAGLSWAYAALTFGFALSWVVLAVAAPGEIGLALWTAIALFLIVAASGIVRGARARLCAPDVGALAVVAVWLQVAWVMNPGVPVSAGQRCMVTTAVVFGGFAFASRGVRVASILTAVGAQLLADWIVVGPLLALGGLWPVATAGIAMSVVVPALRSAARRADRVASEQQRSHAVAAGQGAQHRSHRELQGVLHDVVIPALRAVSLAEVSQAEARAASLTAVAALERAPVAADDDAPRDVAQIVADLQPVAGTVTTIHPGEAVFVPGDVARAVAAAAGEVLRNTARHAQASQVGVTLDLDGDGFVMSISDDGIGFKPSAAPTGSHGLQYSVVRRMQEVGGRADIDSAPGRGTTVRLAWCSVSTVPRRAPTRAERLAAALDDVRGPLAAVCLPYLGMTAVFALWFSVEGELPWWVYAWFVGLCAITLLLLTRSHRTPPGFVVVASLSYGVAGSVTSLFVLPPEALNDYSSWPMGAITALLAVVVMVRPPWEAAVALGVHQSAIVAVALAGRFGPGPWTDQLAAVTPAALSTVTPVMLGAVIGLAILRLGDVVTSANDDRSVRTATESALRARQASHQRRLTAMNEEILPFLRSVADPGGAFTPAEVRARARVLEHTARDELHLPGVLDAHARDLLRRVRADGCVVTIQTGGAEIPAPGLVRDVLVAALASGAPPREIVLSLQDVGQPDSVGLAAGGTRVNLVTVPGDADRASALRKGFGDSLSVLDSTPEATWAEVSVPIA